MLDLVSAHQLYCDLHGPTRAVSLVQALRSFRGLAGSFTRITPESWCSRTPPLVVRGHLPRHQVD